MEAIQCVWSRRYGQDDLLQFRLEENGQTAWSCSVSAAPTIMTVHRMLMTGLTTSNNEHLKSKQTKQNLCPVSWLLWGDGHKSAG